MKSMSFARLRRLPLVQPLAARDFRLLWLGQAISLLGDNFHFVALPWLTLQLTGSGLALGTVLMLAAIPRAAFMLIGGATSDRVSPRGLMLVSNLLRGVLVAALTALIALGAVQLWHLYILATAFGVADAFFYPAFRAIVPGLVGEDRLDSSNALLQGTLQMSALVGPAPAGLLIAAYGIPAAFAVDAVSFFVAAGTLWGMRAGTDPTGDRERAQADPRDPARRGAAEEGRRSLWAAIGDGLRYAWEDPIIRALLLIVAAVDFAFVGPFNVGVAWLADHRFAGGAVAFGTMLSAWGGGALLGALAGGLAGRPRRRGLLVLAVTGALAVGMALIGVVPSALAASAVIAAMGVGSGLINVVGIAWLQARTERAMLGRVMSLVMFASAGLSPVSYALAGALIDLHATAMFVAAGALVLLATAYSALNPAMRRFD